VITVEAEWHCRKDPCRDGKSCEEALRLLSVVGTQRMNVSG
jgi:hypothetical protein